MKVNQDKRIVRAIMAEQNDLILEYSTTFSLSSYTRIQKKKKGLSWLPITRQLHVGYYFCQENSGKDCQSKYKMTPR